MLIVKILGDLISECHEWLEATVSDVTTEQAHWRPPGVANPIAAVYAHVVVGADFSGNMILNQRPPIATASFSGMTGLSAFPGAGNWHDWAGNVEMGPQCFPEVRPGSVLMLGRLHQCPGRR